MLQFAAQLIQPAFGFAAAALLLWAVKPAVDFALRPPPKMFKDPREVAPRGADDPPDEIEIPNRPPDSPPHGGEIVARARRSPAETAAIVRSWLRRP